MPTVDASPDDLLRAYVAGDQLAFERLYDLHARRCFDFIRRMLAMRDEAVAEDLHQEVWLAVAKAAGSFDPGRARFVTWLFTIARNKVMDHFRSSTGVVHLATSSAVEAIDEVAEALELSPEQLSHNRQLAMAIVGEVEALPLVQRETFVLFAYQELSLEEVARVTEVGVETAKSRLRYARKTLSVKLAGWRNLHD